jgi:hypothetical protein
MLEILFLPELKRLVGNDLSRQWFQQDGATAHTLTFIRSELANHIISLHTDNVWPPHCPISILLTFIYRATDLALLKDNISTHVRRIPKEILQKVIQNFKNKRLEKLIIAKDATWSICYELFIDCHFQIWTIYLDLHFNIKEFNIWRVYDINKLVYNNFSVDNIWGIIYLKIV